MSSYGEADTLLDRYAVTVLGEGPTIVYANGFGCNQGVWADVVQGLRKSHRQILFDYAGFGQSDPRMFDPKKYRTLHGYAQDLLSVCRAFASTEPVTLVAHSVGCSIGMLAAIEAPELFRDQIWIGPSPCFLNDPPDYHGGFERHELQGLLELMQRNPLGWQPVLAGIVAGEKQGGSPAVTERLREVFCSADTQAAQVFAKATFFADHRRDVPDMTVPVSILQHRLDLLAPLEVGDWLQARLPRARLQVLDVPGHTAHMSHPELIIEIIRRHFAIG